MSNLRLYIHEKKKSWFTFLLYFLVAVFLSPYAHAHEAKLDDDKIYYVFSLKADSTHTHEDHHAAERHQENLFPLNANHADFSNHDHTRNQHFHYYFQKTLHPKVRKARGLGKYKSLLFLTMSTRLLYVDIFLKVSGQFSPVTILSDLNFVLIATDLPPPVV